jgi:hypothetical protein
MTFWFGLIVGWIPGILIISLLSHASDNNETTAYLGSFNNLGQETIKTKIPPAKGHKLSWKTVPFRILPASP